MTDHPPVDRHLFFSQATLLGTPTQRLRLDIGHRIDDAQLMLVEEVTEQPTRALQKLELRFAPANREGWERIERELWSVIRTWRGERSRLQRDTDPF